jgi:crotonobetaine/carnitine-CoA ligase
VPQPSARWPLTREDCVLSAILERRAREHPGRRFASFDDGASWTYRQAADAASRTAHALQRLGVSRRDCVACWLPTGRDALSVWFGTSQLGAVFVPVNTSYKGALLKHVLDTSGAKVLIAHADLAGRLAGMELPGVEHVVIVGEAGPGRISLSPRIAVSGEAALDCDDTTPAHPADKVEPWDTQAIMYTSGTTGPSKGVLSSYAHLHDSSRPIIALDGAEPDPDECFFVYHPLCHIGGTIPVYGMLLVGASIAVTSAFETRHFWANVRSAGVTRCWMTSIMAKFLLNQPEQSDDRLNPLRIVVLGPLDEDVKVFATRFDVDLMTMFNQTETNMPIISELNPTLPGITGKLRPGVEARLVDEHDREVALGSVGQLVLRADQPWSITHGYHGMPEQTAAAWRNGWFHTGDLMRRDQDGNYFFVSRVTDSIRRRGESVSSYEVEREIRAHPAVREVAVVGVPAELADDEILAVIEVQPDTRLDFAELIDFLRPRMAYFMVPRYMRLAASLPMTQTGKIHKHVLRQEGITPDTWDRESAGIRLRREKHGGRQPEAPAGQGR